MNPTSKTENQETFTALYGNVALQKTICEKCGQEAIVIDEKTGCCEVVCKSKPKRLKRISSPEYRRKKPSPKVQKKILGEQRFRCIYCGFQFGETAFCKGKEIAPKLVWDHFVPFAFAQNNEDLNFFASCNICNSIKSDRSFESLEEAKEYILERRKSKGYENKMSELQARDESEAGTQKVLLRCVSCELPHFGNCVVHDRKALSNNQRSSANIEGQRNNHQKQSKKQRNKRGENFRANPDTPEQYQPDRNLVEWLNDYLLEFGWQKAGETTGLSRTILESYANDRYFKPKEEGGLGVRSSKIEEKLRRFKDDFAKPQKTVETLVEMTDNEQVIRIVGNHKKTIAVIQIKNNRIISIEINAN